MAWTFKIFPSIGIARLGNCPGDSPAGFYVGPEIPLSVIVPVNGYKDAQGRVRRQAARFRIFGWEDGVFMGEITTAVAGIEWTVELANTKAAFNQFQGVGHTDGPLRNASVSDRSSLMITPGPRTVGPGGKAVFDTGQFLGTPVPLGEIQTDSAGRLLVLGGFGSSASPINAPITTFANNDGWHDDVSDGPVNATVTLGGKTYLAVGPGSSAHRRASRLRLRTASRSMTRCCRLWWTASDFRYRGRRPLPTMSTPSFSARS